MKILYLSHRIPFPPNKGDKIRSFNQIKCLSKDNEIHLACRADNPADLRHEEKLREFCSKITVVPLDISMAKLKALNALFSKNSLSVCYFYSKRLQTSVDAYLASESYDAVAAFSSPMAEYLFRSARAKDLFGPNRRKTKLVMDFCDVDSDKWLQYSEKAAFPLNWVYRTENRRLLEYERKINRAFDCSVFSTGRELDLFRQVCPDAVRLHSIPNGVDYEYFSPSATPCSYSKVASKPVLLFAGAMDYHANVDAVLWFSERVFPSVQRRCPEIEFHIVGSNPVAKVANLQRREGIEVAGFIEDIRPHYKAASVCVVPLRIARGIQNKVLEAMAMEKPTVATSQASEGVGAEPGKHLLVKDAPEEFADAVVELLENKALAERLGKNARGFVMENYDWAENMKKMEEILNSPRPKGESGSVASYERSFRPSPAHR